MNTLLGRCFIIAVTAIIFTSSTAVCELPVALTPNSKTNVGYGITHYKVVVAGKQCEVLYMDLNKAVRVFPFFQSGQRANVKVMMDRLGGSGPMAFV